MSILTVTQNGITKKVEFFGTHPLWEVLKEGGFLCQEPCGGLGKCGKCAVELHGDVSEPNANEERLGVRLSCQAVLYGDSDVVLPDLYDNEQIEVDSVGELGELMPMPGEYGCAVDIGTTTVALKLYDLKSGSMLATSAKLNPQGTIAADVMGRIGAAMQGRLDELTRLIHDCLKELLSSACLDAKIDINMVKSMVVTGNTTMLYLLSGRDTTSLSCYPFEADTLFDNDIELFDKRAYLPPCMNAFVGADITCAVLFSGMLKDGKDISLLCDIGTNGELALYKDGCLYVTSTAAGPAFEGAGISCGCAGVKGAIDSVNISDGELAVHSIGEAEPIGICGSGLIDAVAACLELDIIDETGALDDDIILAENVKITPKDVRAVQLAKAAIAAGIDTLIKRAGISYEDITTLYIAGGFGKHLNGVNAGKIGIIPEQLIPKIKVIGNAALGGAARLLLNTPSLNEVRDIAKHSTHVNLGGDAMFNDLYIENMLF